MSRRPTNSRSRRADRPRPHTIRLSTLLPGLVELGCCARSTRPLPAAGRRSAGSPRRSAWRGRSISRSCAASWCRCGRRCRRRLLGSGKAKEIATALEADPAELVVIDGALSPVQQRNLEKIVEDQGHRPDRPDPRDLRPARPDPRGRASGRAGAPDLPALAAGPLVDPSRAAARRLRLSGRAGREPARARPSRASPSASSASRRSWPTSSARAGCTATPASASPIPWWRWSATPTPASRPCSTG